MAREQVEARSKEEVLTALGAAVASLRERLGESLASVTEFDVPLPRATTPSLEALHAYALALDRAATPRSRSRRSRTCCAPSSSTPTSPWRRPRSRASTPTPTGRRWRRSIRSARSTCATASASASATSSRGATTATRMQDWAKALDLARAWTARLPARGVRLQRAWPGRRAPRPAAAKPRWRCARRSSSTRASCRPRATSATTCSGRASSRTPRRTSRSRLPPASITRRCTASATWSRCCRTTRTGWRRISQAARKTGDVLDMASWDARVAAFYGRLAEGHDGVDTARQQALQLNFKEWAARYYGRGRRDPCDCRALRRGASIGARGARVEPRHHDARPQRPRARLVRRPAGAGADARDRPAVSQRQPAPARVGADRHRRLHGADRQPVGRARPARSGEALRRRDHGQAVAGVPARAHLRRPQGPGTSRGRVRPRHRAPLRIGRLAVVPDGAARAGACRGGGRRHRGRGAGTTSSCSRCGGGPIGIWSRSSRPAARPRGSTDVAGGLQTARSYSLPPARDSSRLSHALAWVHSPSTVRTDTPSASATSGTVRPPK